MANKKITELNAATDLAATDVLPVVDVSADETKKITATNLFRTLPDGTAAAPALALVQMQQTVFTLLVRIRLALVRVERSVSLLMAAVTLRFLVI